MHTIHRSSLVGSLEPLVGAPTVVLILGSLPVDMLGEPFARPIWTLDKAPSPGEAFISAQRSDRAHRLPVERWGSVMAHLPRKSLVISALSMRSMTLEERGILMGRASSFVADGHHRRFLQLSGFCPAFKPPAYLRWHKHKRVTNTLLPTFVWELQLKEVAHG